MRWIAASTALLMVTQLLVSTSAAAAGSAGNWTPPNTPNPAVVSVPTHELVGSAHPAGTTMRSWHAPTVALPAAGTVNLVLPAPTRATAHGPGHRMVGDPDVIEAAVAPARVGTSPILLRHAGSGTTATNVSVQFAGADVAQRMGFASGLMWGISQPSGTSAAVEVQLDTKALAGMSGGNFDQRLTLVALPACALSTPDLAACRARTPVRTSRDGTGHLVATVAVPVVDPVAPADPVDAKGPRDFAGGHRASAAAGPAVPSRIVLAADSAPAGSAGTFGATPLQPSDQWSQSGASGAFTYAYPLVLPPTLGGSTPSVAFSYSSQTVDGMTAATNSQTSWLGAGWEYNPGFIERSYQPCVDAGIANSGDTCWSYGGAEVALNGPGGGRLVRDDGGGNSWHFADDNGSKIQQLTATGATANGAYNGEYWVITGPDGTRRYYGAGHLPAAEGGTGIDPATNSAWTEPVYCAHSGDPCYNTSTGTSSFAPAMAYRWHLDYVVDPHGNTTVYSYGTETNYYARSSAHVLTSYVRGGYLSQISYGWRAADVAAQATPNPAAKVVFTPAQRCTGSAGECSTVANLTSATKADWPDTPFDLICGSSGTCANTSISYFSTVMLASVQTQVNKAGTYKPVDTYTVAHTFPDPGDTSSPSVWLSSLTRTGNNAPTAISLPPVTFGGTLLPNRVPGSLTWPAYNHLRISSIMDESGGQISVSYANTTPSVAACDQSAAAPTLPSATDNTMLCYQQYWSPPQQSPTADWFEKYVVTQVSLSDQVATASRAHVTNYAYGGLPAWHRDDQVVTKNSQRTWDVFRGFATVTTTVGAAPDPITQSTTTYLRGMNGDYRSQTGGAQRSVTVTDALGNAVVDANQYADTPLQTDYFREAGGPVRARRIVLPWSTQTASHAETAQPGLPSELAFFTDTGTTISTQLLASGSWRTTKSVNTFSTTTGLLARTDDQGDVATVGTAASAETCTTTTPATAPASGLNAGLTGLVGRVVTVSVGAAGPIGTGACPAPTAANTISDTLTYYDNNTSPGIITAVGDVTRVAAIDGYPGGTATYADTMAATTYDPYGRLTGTTNARGLVTTTAYTPATGQLPTTVVDTDVTNSTTVTMTLDQARQSQTKRVDANNLSTSQAFDALGRRTSVWLPGRPITQAASLGYVYAMNGAAAPSTVLTKTLRDDGTYATAYQIYDGLGQLRQSQDVSKDGTNGRLVTDTFYDSHGWKVKETSPYTAANLPSPNPVGTADSAVPAETLSTYDGSGRVLTSAFYSHANLQWQTVTAYPGADRTDVTPPAGGTVTSVYTDAYGHDAARWSYTTPTATGNAADARITGYAYYPSGKLKSVTGPAGAVWSYTYDLHGRAASTVDPDTGSTATVYSPAGDLTSSTDANGQLLTYTYDKLGRRTASYAGTAATGTKLASWTYDTAPNGKGLPATQTSYVGGAGGAAYTQTVTGYTNRGQITGASVTIPASAPAAWQPLVGTYTASATYGANSGLMSSASYGADGGLPAETVTYSHNQNGVLTNFGGVTGYLGTTQVDPFGRITRWNLGAAPNQVVQTNLYDEATGRVMEQFLDKQSGSSHVDDVTTLYNPVGQTTAITDVQGGIATDRQCFAYNRLGQLTDAWSDSGGVVITPSPSVTNIGTCANTTPSASTVGGPAAYWQTYHYNSAGNRDTETDHDPAGLLANDVGRTYAYNPVGGQPDLLRSQTHTGPSAGTDNYGYDLVGQTTTRTIAGGPNQTLTYTPQHQTASIGDAAGNSSSYLYDAAGHLMIQSSTAGGATTVTLYLGSEQLSLNTGTHAVTGLRYYPTDGGPTVVRSSTGVVAYQFANNQATGLVVIAAGSPQTELRRLFTPFGAPRGPTPASWVDNHGFLDRPTEPAAGLSLLGARVYDPATGRFLQRDPVLESKDSNQLGGYTYAAADPVRFSDPDGQRPCYDDCTGPGEAAARKEAQAQAAASVSVLKNVRHQVAQIVAYFYIRAQVQAAGLDPDAVEMEVDVAAGSKEGTGNPGHMDIIYTSPSGVVYIWEVKSDTAFGTPSNSLAKTQQEVKNYITAYKTAHPGVDVLPGWQILPTGAVLPAPDPVIGEVVTIYSPTPGVIMYNSEKVKPPSTPDPPGVPVTDPHKVPVPIPQPTGVTVPDTQPNQQPVRVPNPQPGPPVSWPSCTTCVPALGVGVVIIILIVIVLAPVGE